MTVRRIHISLTVILFTGSLLAAQQVYGAATIRHFAITPESTTDIHGNPGSPGALVGSLHNILSEATTFDLASPVGLAPQFVEGRLGGDDLAIYFDGQPLDSLFPPGPDNQVAQILGPSFCALCPDPDVQVVMEAASEGLASSTTLRALQLWVKPDIAGLGADQVIIKDGRGQWGGVGITASGNWAHIQSIAGNVKFSDTGMPVDFDEWTNVAQYSGLWGPGWLFINGSYADRRGTSYGTGQLLNLGSDVNGFSKPFIGALDDVKLMIASGVVGGFVPENDLDFFENINFSGVAGDVNQDGLVNRSDYDIWSQNFGLEHLVFHGETVGTIPLGDAGTHIQGDVNRNGIVDLADLAVIKAGARAAAAPAIPEPASLMLLAAGGLFAAYCRTGRAG